MPSSPVRKLLYVSGGLLLALVIAVVWLVATFDPNAYKGLAVDWMKAERNRTLTIDGPVDLSVFPRLSVKLSGVTLSEAGRPDEFAHLDEVSLSVATMPLLKKRLEVDRITARGVRAVYRRAADGTTNIDDLLDKQKPEPEATGGPAGEALKFDVQAIRLDDLKLSVHDALAQLDGSVAVAVFSTGRLADGVESPVELDAQVQLTQPAVQGRLTGKTALTLALKDRSVALRDMQLTWRGDVPGVRALDARVTGALAWNGAAGTVSAEPLDVALGASVGALKLDGTQVAVKRFAYDPARQHLALEALRLRVAGTQDGQPLKLDLDWPQLEVTGDKLQGGPLTGAVSLQGALAVDGTFKSGAPRGSFSRIELPGFETTLKGRSGARQLSGTVGSDVQIDVAAASVAVNALAARLRIEEPSLQPLALNITGTVGASAQAARWGLKGDINANPFTTDGQVQLSARPVAVTATANFAALDLNRLLPPAPAASPAPAPATPAASGAKGAAAAGDQAPVDLSALRALQGRFAFRAGSFAYGTYRAKNVTVNATLDGGRLRVAPFAGDLWSGHVETTADADAGSNRMALKGSATGIDVAAMLKDVARKDLLEGTGRVTWDVSATGRTVGELKSHLAGAAALQLRDGAIKGVNLARQLREAKAALSTKADTGTSASTTEKTDFSELSASFTVANGIARSSDLDVKSPFLRLGGDGLVDLPQSRIDYTVRATVAGTSKGQGGADLAELRGVTIPVRLTGPLDAVEWRIRWSQVAADVIKSQVGQKVEDRLREKLSERLGLPPSSAASGASAAEGAAPKPRDVLKDRLRDLLKK